MKLKDSEYKNSSLVSQIDRKNTKVKSKLLLKCFVKSFTKIPPISARNVPKLPEMSLFEPRGKVTQKDGDLKICPPVGQIDHKNVEYLDKLLSN